MTTCRVIVVLATVLVLLGCRSISTDQDQATPNGPKESKSPNPKTTSMDDMVANRLGADKFPITKVFSSNIADISLFNGGMKLWEVKCLQNKGISIDYEGKFFYGGTPMPIDYFYGYFDDTPVIYPELPSEAGSWMSEANKNAGQLSHWLAGLSEGDKKRVQQLRNGTKDKPGCSSQAEAWVYGGQSNVEEYGDLIEKLYAVRAERDKALHEYPDIVTMHAKWKECASKTGLTWDWPEIFGTPEKLKENRDSLRKDLACKKEIGAQQTVDAVSSTIERELYAKNRETLNRIAEIRHTINTNSVEVANNSGVELPEWMLKY